jgi:hypothetical protein
MTNAPDTPDAAGIDDTSGAPDRACVNCGHMGHEHRVRETEVPGNTIRETFCEICGAVCEFVPEPEG